MLNLFDTLEKLSHDLMEKANQSKTKAATFAYTDSAQLLMDEIVSIKNNIRQNEDYKIQKQMDKFDTAHSDYATILERGHIGVPDASHKELSDFTLGLKTASEVFENLSDVYKETILSTLAADKDMNEQLTAHRHGFHYITHTMGHDGIDKNNKVYEVKNRKYTKRKERCQVVIKFDRVSPANARKLREGKPEVIFNMTDGHKVLVEMKVKFSDKMLELYDKKVEQLKYSKTSGFDIAFRDFKDSVKEITHIDEDLYGYHIQKNFLDYVSKTSPTHS